MKPFPVNRLNENITQAISKIVSIDIHKGIENGLDPMIHLEDEKGGPITDIAKITEIPAALKPEYKRKVAISAAFMQILWIICDIVLKINDSIALNVEIERLSDSQREQFYQELAVDTDEIRFLRAILDEKNVYQKSADEVNLIEMIATRQLNEQEMESLYTLDMDSSYGKRVNGMYTYAMAFCLLHEFSHHSLDHDFSIEGSIEEEIAADQEAFWSMYSDLNDKAKLTAMYGIISLLVSLIFINKELIDDGIHPKPIERIFGYYELIKEENPKYAGLLCHLFYTWAVYTGDNDMPKWDRPYNELVYQIRDHLLEIERRNNN